MPTSEELTDAYVAELLKRDAERGLSYKRSRSDAPKPNTRFLRNIVRDVDSHNAALKAKEEQEARARQRKLRRDDRMKDRKQSGDGNREESLRSRDREDKRGHTEGHKDRGDGNGPRREERHGEERRRNRRDNEKDKDARRRRRPRSRTRSRSPRRRSAAYDRATRHANDQRHKNPRTDRLSPPERRSSADPHTPDPDSDSDVLGPAPPPKNPPRGRGAYRDADIDARFGPSYNPREDVAPDHDEGLAGGDDWDMALEAVRDRAKWRCSGAERLRAAGFTDQEVLAWQGGGSKLQGSGADKERDIRNLVWKKQGEKRAWDEDK